MNRQSAFADVLEAAGHLDAEAQAELVSILSLRLAEGGRERVTASLAEARREFSAGDFQPMSVAEILREAQS